MLTIWVTMSSTIGITTKRQERFEIRRRTTMQKFIHKCCSFENATVPNRQPVEIKCYKSLY